MCVIILLNHSFFIELNQRFLQWQVEKDVFSPSSVISAVDTPDTFNFLSALIIPCLESL